eukprot:sb/3467854/
MCRYYMTRENGRERVLPDVLKRCMLKDNFSLSHSLSHSLSLTLSLTLYPSLSLSLSLSFTLLMRVVILTAVITPENGVDRSYIFSLSPSLSLSLTLSPSLSLSQSHHTWHLQTPIYQAPIYQNPDLPGKLFPTSIPVNRGPTGYIVFISLITSDPDIPGSDLPEPRFTGQTLSHEHPGKSRSDWIYCIHFPHYALSSTHTERRPESERERKRERVRKRVRERERERERGSNEALHVSLDCVDSLHSLSLPSPLSTSLSLPPLCQSSTHITRTEREREGDGL